MEIADLVLATLGKPASLKEIVPDRPGHDRRYLLDSSKLRNQLGWAPEISWEDGLAQTVEWYAGQPRLVGAAAGPSPGRRGRMGLGRLRPALLHANSRHRGRRAARAATCSMRWPGGSRSAAGGAACWRPRARCPGWTTRCWPPTSAPCAVDDRDAVQHRVPRLPAGPGAARRGASPPSTPARPRSIWPTPSTPSAPATWPRPPRPSVPTCSTSPPTTSSTAPRPGPTASGTPPTPCRSTGPASWPASGSARPGRPSCARRGSAGPTGRTWSRPPCGWPRATGPCASSTTSTARRPSRPTWPRPSSRSGRTGARASST